MLLHRVVLDFGSEHVGGRPFREDACLYPLATPIAEAPIFVTFREPNLDLRHCVCSERLCRYGLGFQLFESDCTTDDTATLLDWYGY